MQIAVIDNKISNQKNESGEIQNEIQESKKTKQNTEKDRSCLILLEHSFHFKLAEYISLYHFSDRFSHNPG